MDASMEACMQEVLNRMEVACIMVHYFHTF